VDLKCLLAFKHIFFNFYGGINKMAVKIRLKRMGKKRHPIYRIVVADSRSPRDGRFIEEIGTYDPNQEPSVFDVNEEAAKKWLSTGAKPTETVGKLLKIAGIEK
jgi:small subunit ribosomal protein S16